MLFYSNNLDLLPPKPKLSFRYLKQGIQEFHGKYVLAQADKAANNVVVVWQLYYTLIQDLFVPKHMNGFLLTRDLLLIPILSILLLNLQWVLKKSKTDFLRYIGYRNFVSIKEKQDRLPTLYWLPKLHKRPYEARFIANSSSCATTVLSKLLTSCFTAVKNIGLDTMILFTKWMERTNFGQFKFQRCSL